jgi:hypothetical protein
MRLHEDAKAKAVALVAYCEGPAEVCRGIKTIIRQEPFYPREELATIRTIEDYLGNTWGLMPSLTTYSVRLRLPRPLASYVAERQ